MIFFYVKAAKTQILLGSYLNTKIDLFDIKKVRIMWKLYRLYYALIKNNYSYNICTLCGII